MPTDPTFLPGTSKSQKIRKLLRENIDFSERAISQNYESWDEIEESYRAWRPVDDADRESIQKYGVQKIIIPIQFATIQTMLTFMMEIFTALTPMLRVRGAEPSSMRKARVMEVALDYDYRGNRGYYTMNQWFLNSLRYGYGIIRNTWGQKTVLKKMIVPGETSTFNIGGETYNVPGSFKTEFTPFVTFEGNIWENVDNRLFFWDPRYPLGKFQEGNFVAERSMIHDHELYDMERDGLFFNTKEVTKRGGVGFSHQVMSGEGFGINSNRRDIFGGRYSIDTLINQARKNKMHINETQIVRLIPRDMELGDEDYPIDFLFNVIDDEFIVRAEPSEFLPRFPYSIIETYPDVLAVMTQGVMELTQPLANHLNFLFNSHMANVRKAVNDRFVGDPSRIDINEFLDPENVIVRLLPGAYGTNPADALQQLNVVDITKNHFADAQALLDFWERITGASSHMFGQISSGRRTAFELQGVFRQAGARMKMMADLFSVGGVAPLTEQMALLRQNNMSMPQFMEIAGQTAADMGVDPMEIIDNLFINVTPAHLDGVFRFPAAEGVLPIDRAAAAEILQDTFNAVISAPFMMQAFDPVEIFKELVRQKGLYHIDDFLNKAIRAQTMIMTPDQIANLYATNKIQPTNLTNNQNANRDRSQPLTLQGAVNGAGAPQQSPQGPGTQ